MAQDPTGPTTTAVEGTAVGRTQAEDDEVAEEVVVLDGSDSEALLESELEVKLETEIELEVAVEEIVELEVVTEESVELEDDAVTMLLLEILDEAVEELDETVEELDD